VEKIIQAADIEALIATLQSETTDRKKKAMEKRR